MLVVDVGTREMMVWTCTPRSGRFAVARNALQNQCTMVLRCVSPVGDDDDPGGNGKGTAGSFVVPSSIEWCCLAAIANGALRKHEMKE